jgi:hypothetical protein
MSKVELRGVKQVIKHNKKVMVEHRKAIQVALGNSLTLTRLRAQQHLIPNTTGFVAPKRARYFQPSTHGRLTSRTGRLGYMLKYGASASNPKKTWDKSTLGQLIYKETKNVGLKGQVRAKRISKNFEEYRATYRVFISDNARLFSRVRGMPRETKKTLAMRFNWETGIRGGVRPIFAPVVNRTIFDVSKEVKRKDAKIWR